jgi:iron complex transport system substrate-binding protein
MKKIYVPAMLIMVLFLSCSGKNESEEKKTNPLPGNINDVKSVVDSRGVTVEYTAFPDSIATFPVPHPHIIAYLDGNGKRITGLHPLAKKAAAGSVLYKIAPNILRADSSFLSGSSFNSEELLKINPDIFFTDKVLQGMDNLEKTSLPVIYLGLEKEKLKTESGDVEVFSPLESIKNWIDITASVLDSDKDKASFIITEWEDTEKFIQEKLESAKILEKKKILILFKVRENLVSGGNSFGQYWISATGGINCASSIKGKHPAMSRIADFEDILKWNPDIVYITNFDPSVPDDLYSSPGLSDKWANVNAVKNREVYKIPLGIYRWYPPGLDGPLMLKWMAQKNYPEIFSWDIKAEIKKYFEKSYNYSLTEEEIEKILNPDPSGSF